MEYLHSTVIDSNRKPDLRLLNNRLSDATVRGLFRQVQIAQPSRLRHVRKDQD